MVGKKGPFGGFCNYGIFGIWGKDPGTGKKKYKKVDAVSEAAAVEKAAALGCVDPQSVEVIHSCRHLKSSSGTPQILAFVSQKVARLWTPPR